METAKALVAYGTGLGGTARIAGEIAEGLRRAGIHAESRPAGHVQDVEDYAAVLVGSPVSGGRWRPEAVDFLNRHRRALRKRHLWLFQAGSVQLEGDETIPLPRDVASAAKRARALGVLTLSGNVADTDASPVSEATLAEGARNPESVDRLAGFVADTIARRRAG